MRYAIIIFGMVSLLSGASAQVCNVEDSLQLVALYNATDGANWKNGAVWYLTQPVYSWLGIRLNAEGNVTDIFLANCGLKGSLPNFNLPQLEHLDFNQNQLSGTIPNFNLPQLKQLILEDNQLTGSIPNFNLPNLKVLVLYQNQLNGSIPNFNLPQLEQLQLGKNQLSGSIPNFKLPKLHVLYLGDNQLSGCIPAGIKINCPLIGTGIGSLGNNPNLATQDWASYWNNGTGACAAKTDTLSIAANQCGTRKYRLPSGRIVNAVGVYSDTIHHVAPLLDTIYTVGLLADNSCRCQDSIQLVELFNATNGAGWSNKVNWLSDNSINTWSGITITNTGCVATIKLGSTELRGNLPNVYFAQLNELNLSSNHFTGSLPNFNLPNLVNLYLDHNYFTGSLPNFNLPALKILGLGYNQLSDSIPNFNLPKLEQFDLSHNQLSGNLPNFNLLNLKILSIGYNQLSGSIPNFNLPKLGSLILEFNQLSGCIPARIKTNCPLLGASGGNIALNPNLSTQSWADYWNNGTGMCSPTVYGGNRVASLCGDRDFQLPSGRVVNVAGLYADTLHDKITGRDTAYAVQVNRDTTGHCQDSIALAYMYHTSGGFPNYWDLKQPLNTWAGLTFNAAGEVVIWRDPRPDTVVIVRPNQNYILYGDFGIFNSLQLPQGWVKNDSSIIENVILNINLLQRVDTGRYKARLISNGNFSMLPQLQYAENRAIRLKFSCKPTLDSVSKTIVTGSCLLWAGVNRCNAGSYKDTLLSTTGCDSVVILNLRLVSAAQDLNDNPTIKIFPNPSESVFHLESTAPLEKIVIYNSIGRWVQSFQTTAHQLDIDWTGMATGIYIVKIGAKVYKIVKQ